MVCLHACAEQIKGNLHFKDNTKDVPHNLGQDPLFKLRPFPDFPSERISIPMTEHISVDEKNNHI